MAEKELNTDTSSASPIQDELDAKKKDLGAYDKIPKFNELWYQVKEGERQLKKRDKEMSDMKDLFFNLDERMDDIIPVPDPEVDPEGFKKHIADTATRKVAREAKRTAPSEEAKAGGLSPIRHTKESLEQMEIIERRLHSEDFNDVVGPVMLELQTNNVLASRMYSSENPAKAIYDYGKAIKDDKISNDANLKARGKTESGDGGDELIKKNSGKYSYNGKIMNDNQLTAWKRAGLPMDKLILIK